MKPKRKKAGGTKRRTVTQTLFLVPKWTPKAPRKSGESLSDFLRRIAERYG